MKPKEDGGTVPDGTCKEFIDKSLEFGKYQNLLIWIFGTSIGN